MVLMVWLLPSCEHKELCYDHPHNGYVEVRFDWTEAPEANPEGMVVYFYPTDGRNSYRRFDLKGTEGGVVALPAGSYTVLSYNNDTEGLLFSGTNKAETHHFYTREGDILEPVYGNTYGSRSTNLPHPSGSADERVVISPDRIWGDTLGTVEVVLLDTVTIRLRPWEMTCTYNYEVKHVGNLGHMTAVCGTISGLSGEYYPCTGELGTEGVTVPFGGEAEGDTTLIGSFQTFGNMEKRGLSDQMVFYVWMDDGTKYAYGTTGSEKYDVTLQVDTAPDPHHVHIVIDGLELPEVIPPESGFTPSVDDWDEVEQDISL